MLLTAGLFFGVGGLHRFYVGKIGTGVLWLVTGGGFLIGQIVDVILIAMGQFRDEQGRLLITWENDNELDMPLRETPAGVEHAEPIRETADGESPESVEDESAVAEADSNVWHASSAVRSVVSPRQTNWVLAGVGRLILLAAILIGLAWAANVAGMIQGGMIPGLGEELSDDVFGTPAWPQIVQRLGWAATVIVTLLAAAVLVMARQGAGFVHMLRAVFGVGTLLGAIYSLNNALHAISWFAVIGSFRAEQTGAAIEMGLNQVHGDDAVLAAVLFLASIFILAWPERRERRFLAELGGEGDG